MKNYKALTLIELLIALTIGMLVISFAMKLYAMFNLNYNKATNTLRLQEKMLIAESILRENIKKTSYLGCLKSNSLSITSFKTKFIKKNSNGITLNYLEKINALESDMTSNLIMHIGSNEKYLVDDKLMIIDCNSNETFKPKTIEYLSNYQKIILSNPLTKKYLKSAEVAAVHTQSYYIKDTGRRKNNNIVYALYVEEQDGKSYELIEGVTDFKVNFDVKHTEDKEQVLGCNLELIIEQENLEKQQFIYVSYE